MVGERCQSASHSQKSSPAPRIVEQVARPLRAIGDTQAQKPIAPSASLADERVGCAVRTILNGAGTAPYALSPQHFLRPAARVRAGSLATVPLLTRMSLGAGLET